MAGFKSDAQGFLVGELVESNRDILRSQQQSVNVWKAIRTDVRSIARAMNVQVATVTRASRPGAAQSSRGTRTIGGNYAGGRQVVQAQGRSSAPAQRAGAGGARTSAPVASTVSRSSNGRFVAGMKAAGAAANDGGSGAPSGSATGGAITHLSDSIGKLSASMAATENVDPTINAAKEISDVVSPLGRGLFSMFGRNAERKKERWYQRIWKALTSPVGAKAGAPTAGGGGMVGGLFGGLGRGLMMIPAILGMVFMRVLAPVAALWGAFELGQWVGKKIYEWLDESGLMAKAFDAFDAIGAAFETAWSSVSSGIDTVVSSISSAWKTSTDAFTSAIQSFITFPDKIGEVLTGIDSALRKIPVIGDIYGKAADAIKNTASDVKRGFNEGASGSTSAAPTSAAQAAGRDGGKIVGAVKAVGAQAGAGYDAARSGSTDAPAPANMAQRAARAVGGAAGAATGWVLGQTSKQYESGRGGAGTVSTGRGDFGGASYGTYQLSSKSGTLDKYLKTLGYGSQFEGLKAGTPEFNAKWKDIAKNDPTFGESQHEFIKKTHYDPLVGGLKQDGIDISGRGAAVQDAAWSTSVQFGGNSKLIQKALAGKDHAKMSDAEMVTAIQDYKAANNDALFKSASAEVRASALGRATNEKRALLKLEGGTTIPSGAVPAAVVTASMPTAPAANVPSSVPVTIPALPDTPAPATPLNSGAGLGRGFAQINIPEKTGQNIGNRGIAHIVTGGLGAS